MISEENARSVLEPHFERLWRIAQRSFEQSITYPNRPIHRTRTKANEVSDLMIHEARKEFEGVPGALFRELDRKELTLLELNDQVLIWFKKLDTKRMSRNVLTFHVRRILSGDVPDIPGITEAASLLIAGYTLNRERTKIFRVSIVPPTALRKKRPEWYIDIESNGYAGVVGMPSPGSDPNSGNTEKRSRVVVKHSPKQINIPNGT